MAYRLKMRLLLVLLAGGVLLQQGCARTPLLKGPANAVDRLRAEFDEVLANPDFATGYWGVVIQSLQNGQYLYLRNPYRGFMPASNMKLFTTATALRKLGPDYRYVTPLFGVGEQEDSVFVGDLVIRGAGDPSITGRYHDDDPLSVFKDWVDSLRARGIVQVSGRIIGDDNYFADEIMGAGWAWDYQSDWYAAQISALSFNDNCVDVFIEPGAKEGELARLTLRPDTRYVRVLNQVYTVRRGLAKGVTFWRKRNGNEVRISGSVELGGKGFWDWFSVENPTLYAAYVFRETLLRNGISVQGKAFDIDSLPGFHYEPDSAVVLARYTSPPLSEIVHTVNKVSQNLYAELLLRTLGKVFTDVGDAEHGVSVVKQFLASVGGNPETFKMVDGSGLSRLNLVTPMHISVLLRAMRNDEAFYQSLPVAGIDGTIKGRMKGTSAEGNVHAKTGYIGRARALSGYVSTEDGEELSFVLLVNNYIVPTAEANRIQDWICERLASFSRKRTD